MTAIRNVSGVAQSIPAIAAVVKAGETIDIGDDNAAQSLIESGLFKAAKTTKKTTASGEDGD